jgi:hypothetical protein
MMLTNNVLPYTFPWTATAISGLLGLGFAGVVVANKMHVNLRSNLLTHNTTKIALFRSDKKNEQRQRNAFTNEAARVEAKERPGEALDTTCVPEIVPRSPLP